jgi:hypothetical protein
VRVGAEFLDRTVETKQPKRTQGSASQEETSKELDLAEVFAQLSFWYGLPYRDIRHEMPFAAIQAYLKQLPALQAELRLMLGEAASVPHWETDTKEQWVRELGEQTGREPTSKARVATPAALALRGIRVMGLDTAGKPPAYSTTDE